MKKEKRKKKKTEKERKGEGNKQQGTFLHAIVYDNYRCVVHCPGLSPILVAPILPVLRSLDREITYICVLSTDE